MPHVYSRQVKSCSEWLLVRLLFPVKYWSSQGIKNQGGPKRFKVLTRPVISGTQIQQLLLRQYSQQPQREEDDKAVTKTMHLV